MIDLDTPPEKPAELLAKEEAARDALRKYCRGHGKQVDLCRKTGIDQATISRLISGKPSKGTRNGTTTASLEQALLIEVHTAGQVRADVLCPSKAYLLRAALLMRYG